MMTTETAHPQGIPARAGLARIAWRLVKCVIVIVYAVWTCALLIPFWKLPRRMRWVSDFGRRVLWALGLTVECRGTPGRGPLLLVSNHVSWLDIMAINSVSPARFVSKAAVRHWPVVGWIVECGNTLFIERESKRDALRVVHQVAESLQAGDVVAVFPEGTTSDGHAVRPFHANLLQAAVSTCTPVQPIVLRFSDAANAVSPAAPYTGDMTLVDSIWSIVGTRGLKVRVTLLPPVPSEGVSRRELSDQLHAQIEAALPHA
jgi:1-acyl-sn-glycerol-3-phosphate acyltransferase